MGGTPNAAFAGRPIPESANDPYDTLYGEPEANAAAKLAPAQKQATINEEPWPYPNADGQGRQGNFT